MRRHTALAAGIALALVASGSASAAILVATYTGTVKDGFDLTGEFGVAGADLTGLSYVSVYRYDTARGVRTTVPGVSDEVLGGSFYGATSPVLSGSVTINGITQSFAPDLYSLARTGAPPATIQHELEMQHIYGPGIKRDYFLSNIMFDDNAPANLNVAYVGHPFGSLAFLSGGSFNFQDNNPLADSHSAYGNLTATEVRIVVERGGGQGVPEATTWMLMVGGFGLVGTALRRRRSALIA